MSISRVKAFADVATPTQQLLAIAVSLPHALPFHLPAELHFCTCFSQLSGQIGVNLMF